MSDLIDANASGELFKSRPWYKLPRLLAMVKLVEIRNELREKNLHDTEEPPLEEKAVPADLDPALREARSTDGSFNDLHVPKMGAAGCRFGRNVPLQHTFPDTPNLLVPNPRHRQPRADDARPVPAGDHPEPAGGLVDPVHGARLVRARSLEDRAHRHPDRRGRRLGRAKHPGPALRPRQGARRVDAAAGLRQSEQPLVGLVADLRLRRRHGREAAHAHRRQAPHRADRPAAGRSRDRRAFRRLQRQLVDRPGDAPHALHAGAQLPLRSARARSPGLERRAAVSQGQTDQLRADGEDPHRRVDAGDPAAPDHQAGDERQLVRPGRRGPPGAGRAPRRQGTARRHRRLAGRSSHARRIR